MSPPLTLVRGRLRPVPWAWLAVLAAGWGLLTQLMASAVGDPNTRVVAFRWAALLLGLGGAVLAAPETDPPRDVLRAAPVPLWGTLVLRLAGWLVLGRQPSWPWRGCWTAPAAGRPPTSSAAPCRTSCW